MRLILRGLSVIVVLVGLAFAALWLIPADVIARAAGTEFQRLTGRTLTVEGDVRPTLWPVIGISTGRVTLANADWSGEGPMLVAEDLSVALDVAAALRGQVKIRQIDLRGARLVLERGADGRENWNLGGNPAPPPGDGTGAAADGTVTGWDRLVVTDAAVLWIDHASATRIAVEGIAAEAAWPAPDAPLTLTAEGRMADTPLRLSAELADAATLLAGGVGGVSLRVAAGGSTADFDGRAGLVPAVAEGRLALNLADMRAVAALTGQSPPDLPEGMGRRLREMTGQVTLAPAGSLHLRDAAVTLDGNRIAVAADLTLDGPRPKLAAQVQAGTLTMPGMTGGGDGGGDAGTDAGWSRERIDVSALATLDAEVALTAETVDLGGTRAGPLRMMLTVDRARAVIEARELQAFGGQISGQFVVNGRGGLSVGGDLVLAGLAMQPLLSQLAGYDRLISNGDLRVKFLGVGDSMATIMASLKGDGRVVLGQGELRGFDLLGMLRRLDASYVGPGQTTIFNGLSASFTVENGVLRNDDLRMTAPYVTASGQGTVGLGAQVIDYRITPTALTKEDGTGGVRVPLIVSGPWSDPRFRLDLKALADQELAEERARLEARAKEAEAKARAQLEAKAAEELGVVRQDGESLEDAAKRRAEEALRDEAGRALNRLLGGN
ncbi:MAG: AsmA family protein [Paracoccaceae bacterium]|nr:MAG: AsmA family protein [Paracoccaceae bacterium]